MALRKKPKLSTKEMSMILKLARYEIYQNKRKDNIEITEDIGRGWVFVDELYGEKNSILIPKKYFKISKKTHELKLVSEITEKKPPFLFWNQEDKNILKTIKEKSDHRTHEFFNKEFVEVASTRNPKRGLIEVLIKDSNKKIVKKTAYRIKPKLDIWKKLYRITQDFGPTFKINFLESEYSKKIMSESISEKIYLKFLKIFPQENASPKPKLKFYEAIKEKRKICKIAYRKLIKEYTEKKAYERLARLKDNNKWRWKEVLPNRDIEISKMIVKSYPYLFTLFLENEDEARECIAEVIDGADRDFINSRKITINHILFPILAKDYFYRLEEAAWIRYDRTILEGKSGSTPHELSAATRI